MAIHVDTNSAPGGDGSELTPFDSVTDVTWSEGIEVLIKRGSSENITTSEFMGVDRSFMTVGAYGDEDDPLPIISGYANDLTSGWEEIATNVWAYIFPVTGFNPTLVLGFDTLENFGIRTQFVETQSQKDIASVIVGSPTQIQSWSHGYSTGDYVYINFVTGAGVAVNGYHQITVVNVNIFTIAVDTTGDGPYSGGRITLMNNANLPSADKDFEYWNGVNATGGNAVLFVYAESDPASYYSNIYYAKWWDAPFTFHRTLGKVTFKDIDFAHCGRPWVIGQGSGSSSTSGELWVHDCIFRESFFGANILVAVNGTQFWLEAIVEDNKIYNMRATGIVGADYVKNSYIRRNLVHDCNQSLSNGGIYFGSCFAPVGEENYIYDNEVYAITAGNYWPSDGVGIMLDSESDNCIISKNYVHDTEIAYNDNSSSNTIWHSNLAVNCDFGMKVSDAEGKLGMDLKIHDNSYVFCGSNLFTESGIPNKNRVIRINCFAGDATANVEIKNNIIYGYSDISSIGISIEQQFILAGSTYAESNNCFYNLGIKLYENGVDVSGTIDATDISVNPLFIDDNSNYNLQESSPCVGIGTQWWGLNPRPDTIGDPKPDRHIDLGAYQSAWNPLHPKKL